MQQTKQLLHIDRLDQVVVKAGGQRGLLLLRLGVAAQGQNAGATAGSVLPKLARQLAPVHTGQADVQDEHVWLLSLRDQQRLLGREDLAGLSAEAAATLLIHKRLIETCSQSAA